MWSNTVKPWRFGNYIVSVNLGVASTKLVSGGRQEVSDVPGSLLCIKGRIEILYMTLSRFVLHSVTFIYIYIMFLLMKRYKLFISCHSILTNS